LLKTLLAAFYRRNALWQLTVIALIPRLVAAIFAQGYFAHDDHFLVIEAAQSWVDGSDYNNWLPWHQSTDARPAVTASFTLGSITCCSSC
jgi:hypothetical protein